MLVLLEAR